MNQLYARLALRLVSNAACRALATGLGLGTMFWLITVLRPGDAYSALMGVVLMGSGGASFVFYTLGMNGGSSMALEVRRQVVQDWIVALSLGVLVAINGLDLVLG